MHGARWTRTEDELIRLAYGKAPTERIAIVLQRSTIAVIARAKHLHATAEHRKWTHEDDERLVALYGVVPTDKITETLGRSSSSIKTRAKVLRSMGANI